VSENKTREVVAQTQSAHDGPEGVRGCPSWTQRNFGLHWRRRISWLSERPLSSHEGFSSIESAS